MNWKKVYDQIIENAKSRILLGYSESHHIVPKCLGGNDSSDNLVSLTAREHFICHMILCKITDGSDRSKMTWALHRMTFNGSYRVNSRQYEYIRKCHAKNVSENHPSYRDSSWSSKVSVSNKQSWAKDIERKENTSKRMKQTWEERPDEMLANSRRAAKLGGAAAAIALKGKKRPECAMKGINNPMAKTFVIKSPTGDEIIVDDLKDFCHNNDLSYACMIQVSCGKNKQHKGYTIINKFDKP